MKRTRFDDEDNEESLFSSDRGTKKSKSSYNDSKEHHLKRKRDLFEEHTNSEEEGIRELEESSQESEESKEEEEEETKTTSWGFIGRDVLKRKEKMEEKIHKRRCYRKFEYQDLPSYKKLQNSGRMRLESFERAVRYYFEHSDMKLGYMQKKLIDVFIVAALRKFFENDLISNLKFIANKYLIEELNDAVAILFPVRIPFIYSLSFMHFLFIYIF